MEVVVPVRVDPESVPVLVRAQVEISSFAGTSSSSTFSQSLSSDRISLSVRISAAVRRLSFVATVAALGQKFHLSSCKNVLYDGDEAATKTLIANKQESVRRM